LKRNEEKLKQETSDLEAKVRELTAQAKLKEDKVALYKKECSRKQDEKAEL
jgi:peptidoglycan hydrolase CwlO-like protein